MRTRLAAAVAALLLTSAAPAPAPSGWAAFRDAVVEEWFKIDPANVHILRDLGRVTHAMGDLDRSQKTFRALLLQKLGPDAGITKADVYYYLGDLTAKQGDAAKAISMLERAIAEDNAHAEARARLAELKG